MKIRARVLWHFGHFRKQTTYPTLTAARYAILRIRRQYGLTGRLVRLCDVGPAIDDSWLCPRCDWRGFDKSRRPCNSARAEAERRRPRRVAGA